MPDQLTVWMCMVEQRWAHAPMNRCSSPHIHVNCKWMTIEAPDKAT